MARVGNNDKLQLGLRSIVKRFVGSHSICVGAGKGSKTKNVVILPHSNKHGHMHTPGYNTDMSRNLTTRSAFAWLRHKAEQLRLSRSSRRSMRPPWGACLRRA